MSKIISTGLVCLLILVLLPINIFGDQIVLKNGDRLTGKIVRKDGDRIAAKRLPSENIGLVELQRALLTHISSRWCCH